MRLQNLSVEYSRRMLGGVLVMGLLLGCASCGVALEESQDQAAPLVLRVTNENPMDVRVYALRESAEFRLGIVPTMRTEYFKIPAFLYRATGAVRFRVDPVGGVPSYLTESVLVSGISEIDLRLGTPFVYSRLLVR